MPPPRRHITPRRHREMPLLSRLFAEDAVNITPLLLLPATMMATGCRHQLAARPPPPILPFILETPTLSLILHRLMLFATTKLICHHRHAAADGCHEVTPQQLLSEPLDIDTREMPPLRRRWYRIMICFDIRRRDIILHTFYIRLPLRPRPLIRRTTPDIAATKIRRATAMMEISSLSSVTNAAIFFHLHKSRDIFIYVIDAVTISNCFDFSSLRLDSPIARLL